MYSFFPLYFSSSALFTFQGSNRRQEPSIFAPRFLRRKEYYNRNFYLCQHFFEKKLKKYPKIFKIRIFCSNGGIFAVLIHSRPHSQHCDKHTPSSDSRHIIFRYQVYVTHFVLSHIYIQVSDFVAGAKWCGDIFLQLRL